VALVSSAAVKVLMVEEGVVKALLDLLSVSQSALACRLGGQEDKQ